ncbi:MAG: hypothetical protein RI995_650, partial [Bacteroidota bacterium]
VPLIMDYTREAAASWSRSDSERSSLHLRRKPKSGHNYSTVTDLAKLRGMSTFRPLATPI